VDSRSSLTAHREIPVILTGIACCHTRKKSNEAGSGIAFVHTTAQLVGSSAGHQQAVRRSIRSSDSANLWRIVMKRFLLLSVLSAFGLAIVGCHGSVEPNDNADSHYKKSTTYDNGTKTTKTETSTDMNQ
jgi:hypothetical protein